MPALPPSFLIQATFPISKVAAIPKKLTWNLWEKLTPLPMLKELDADVCPLRLALGWHDTGLLVGLTVSGKSMPFQFFSDDAPASDSVTLCIDTRDTKSIRRGGRFCHRFRILPVDQAGRAKPDVRQEPVPRSREDAPFHDLAVKAISKVTDDGVRVLSVIPAANLNGFDPVESPKLGFFAQLNDIELGTHPLTGDDKLPAEADPSMWSTIDLIPGE